MIKVALVFALVLSSFLSGPIKEVEARTDLESMNTFRMLVLGSPNSGKTFFVNNLLQRTTMVGTVADPAGDIVAPKRFLHLGRKPFVEQIVDATLKQDFPNLMIVDEIHKFIRKQDDDRNNPLADLMDTARNKGLSFIGATKFPTMLPPMVVGLADHILFNPPRLPNVQRWLNDAGVDFQIGERLPQGEWVWIPVGGDPFRVNTEQALELSTKLLDEVQVAS